MRLVTSLALAGALVLVPAALAVGPALANNDPHRVFLPSGPVDLPAGFCSFPTHYDVVANKEYGKFTTLADGTVRLKETGKLKLRATNTDTGESILLNASGPGTLLFFPDGSFTIHGTGHWLIFNLATDAARFGLPAVLLSSGHINETIDSSGALAALSVTGRAKDVCAALG
jgi:hypothetical protein